MIKFMFVGRRAAGRSRKGALDHLRNIHAKMVVCPPEGAGAMPLGYVQNHVIDGAYPATGQHSLDRDLVTELWFDSIAHLRESTQTPYYLENLKPDEPRFVDDASVAKMMVAPCDIREGERGAFKLFVFVTRGDIDDAAWTAGRTAATGVFVGLGGLGAAVANDVQPPPTGGERFVDVVFEGWFAARDDALAAVDRLDGLLAGFGTGAVDAARCFAVAAEEHDRERLRKLHGC